MEKNLQEHSSSCSMDSKKCCTKGIIIVVVCSLVCFFLGYYFGNKSNNNINKVVGSGISRPFNPNTSPRRIPNKPPNIPPGIQNTQRIQRAPIQRPPVQPNVNIQNIKSNAAATQNVLQQKKAATSKKK